MTDTASFVCVGWYRIRARGWCALVECDRDRDRKNPGLAGQPVLIDGEQFLCVAVEMNVPLYPIRKGERIGLLVQPYGEPR
jgi:hypothetical protein